jgi:hypothetical protein
MRAVVGVGVAALLCILFVSFSPSPSNAITFATYGNRTCDISRSRLAPLTPPFSGPPIRLAYDRNFTKGIRKLTPAFHITYDHPAKAILPLRFPLTS